MSTIKGNALLSFEVSNSQLADGLFDWIKTNINRSCDEFCFIDKEGKLLKSHNVYHNDVEFEEISSDPKVIKIFEVAKIIKQWGK